MGANQSHRDLNLSDSDSETESESGSESRTRNDYTSDEYQTPTKTPSSASKSPQTTSSLDEIETRLKSLKLKYNAQTTPALRNSVKLYHHLGGHTGKSKWVVSEKVAFFKFVKRGVDEEEDDAEDEGNGKWVLKIGSGIRVVVDEMLQLKVSNEEKRVDFVANGVWAMRFNDGDVFKEFLERYESCLFENRHGYEDNEANKVKIFGKDFIGWAVPEKADDSMWDAEDAFEKSPERVWKTPVRESGDLREEFEEAATAGGTIQSLALGALDNSFLVSESGVQVVRNYSHGIQGKGVYVNFDLERSKGRFGGGGGGGARTTPRKALLMKAETNMLLMSPMSTGKPHAGGLHQLDIETGSIVSEWKFAKDGADITMRDITNDNKGAQIDPSGSTFLGLDDNRLCRWDMRDRHGIVQDLVNNESTPVLNWAQGHQFSRGTNFQCFATTGDGSIAVGSLDGKIRLYSITSMRQAKTAFPGLGSPITHIDVTFDGKWILGTTDTYLILICSLFTDKDGKTKSGFSGRMGNRISAPRLLKLNPLDAHLAGGSKFRNAQFSWVTENGKQERHLVATVGKFSVIWSFQQVKDGSHECYQNQVGLKSCYCYKIVPKDDSIVESRFMHEKYAVSDSPEAPLVVATPMKVSSFSISSSRLRL